MRSTLLFVLLAAIGCGNSSNNNGNDMSMNKGDMAMSGGSMDMTMAKATCSITGQDCGTGMKCVPTVMGSGQNAKIVGNCVADGTVAEGQACQQTQSQTMLNDDCKAGLTCDNNGAGSTPTCKKFCSADSGCAATDKCAVTIDQSFGTCLTTCTPFGTGCGAGNDCSGNFFDISATMAMPTGMFTCKKTGTGTAFSNCAQDSDCGANLWCDPTMFQGQGCTPICDGTHMCPATDAGAGMCNAFSNTNGAGSC